MTKTSYSTEFNDFSNRQYFPKNIEMVTQKRSAWSTLKYLQTQKKNNNNNITKCMSHHNRTLQIIIIM